MLQLFLAHGLGGRSDLPIPLGLAVRAAGAAVFVSFVALAFLWPEPRLRGAEAGRPLPAVLQRVVDSPVTRTVLRVLVLALALFVVVVGLAGPDETEANIAPWLFHITFWVGLIPASLLLGAFWRYVNPLRLLHGGVARLSGSDPGEGLRRYPERLGYWPAAVSLAAFVWLELVAPARDEPYVVASFIAIYGLVHFIAGAVYGDTWFARGDGFEVYSSFIGRLSPFGRRGDGRLVVRNPLNGIDSVTPRAGLVAVVSVLIGSTAFDGLTRTRIWKDNVEATSIPLGTLGLLGCVLVVAATYVLAARLTARAGGDVPAGYYPGAFAASLIPIALGYAVAHYFSVFMLEGQRTLFLASDPFETGANLFGMARRRIDYALVSPDTIAYTQVGAIVVGHVLGVIAAHDRAVRLLPKGSTARGQFPMLVVMVVYTVTGVALLFGS